MRILVLGCGLQGRAAVQDLATDSAVELTVAEARPAVAHNWLERIGAAETPVVALDASNETALGELFSSGYDAVVDMLPRQYIPTVAAAAVAAGVPLVNTYYEHELRPLAHAAAERGVALLPEIGFDPGIDLVLAGEGVRRLDVVDHYRSYGGGVPVPRDADNPLQYKISWTFEGVLNSYARPARRILDGQVVETPAEAIFEPEEDEIVEVDGVGELEAFPNGDAVRYIERMGVGSVRTAARYALRWPGHKALWHSLVGLGLLEQEPVPGLPGVSPREFLLRHLEPRLQYGDDECDLAVLRVEVGGLRDGRRIRWIWEMVDRRDLSTGLFAMNRCVGYPAAIAARMLAGGTIAGKGLLSPLVDVPYEPFVAALEARGVTIREWSE